MTLAMALCYSNTSCFASAQSQKSIPSECNIEATEDALPGATTSSNENPQTDKNSTKSVPSNNQDTEGEQRATPSGDKKKSSPIEGSVTVENPFNDAGGSSRPAKPAKTTFNPINKIGSSTKSLANFVFDLRGFDWSKEGANALLDTDLNVKSELGREYSQQLKSDQKELEKDVLLMQIALYLDHDPQKVLTSMQNLEQLVGRAEAHRLVQEIGQYDAEQKNWLYQQQDFEQRRIFTAKVLETAAKHDAVLCYAHARLAKYNHRAKTVQVAAKIVYTTLGLASFTPTLVAPIAETALLSFMMATGGPEQDKLLKEIYLSKMMESRCRVLNEKAHLAMEAMDMARTNHNKRLQVCSKRLLQQITDDQELVDQICPGDSEVL